MEGQPSEEWLAWTRYISSNESFEKGARNARSGWRVGFSRSRMLTRPRQKLQACRAITTPRQPPTSRRTCLLPVPRPLLTLSRKRIPLHGETNRRTAVLFSRLSIHVIVTNLLLKSGWSEKERRREPRPSLCTCVIPRGIDRESRLMHRGRVIESISAKFADRSALNLTLGEKTGE